MYMYVHYLTLHADQEPQSTGKRWKSRSGQKITKERPASEEGPLPPKSTSAKKQRTTDSSSKKSPPAPDEPTTATPTCSDDDKSTAKDTSNVECAEGISLTKLIGKAVPFVSDISSSESDSELFAEGKAAEQKVEEIPLLSSQQEGREEEGAGERECEEEREELEEVEKDGVCLKRERKGDCEEQESLVLEQTAVKIHVIDDEKQQHIVLG